VSKKKNEIEQLELGLAPKALGYDVSISTLTKILKETMSQKFFSVGVANMLPVKVGSGAWSNELVTYSPIGEPEKPLPNRLGPKPKR
jgi:hypothetical protein